MNKSELIDAVAASADLPKAAAGRAIDAMIDAITDSLKKDDPVVLVGFGNFDFVQSCQHINFGQIQTCKPINESSELHLRNVQPSGATRTPRRPTGTSCRSRWAAREPIPWRWPDP